MKTQQPIQPPKCAQALASTVLIVLTIVLTGCGADSSSEDNSNNTIGSSNDTPPSLNQAAYMPSTATYQFGYNSIANIKIEGAPQDTDWNRWAMLHDGSTYRLYVARGTLYNTLYQFAYNPTTRSYQYGYNSIDVLTLDLIPDNSDTSEFAMLHDGIDYRFCFLTL